MIFAMHVNKAKEAQKLTLFLVCCRKTSSAGFTRYCTSQWNCTRDKLIADQQTALALSMEHAIPEQFWVDRNKCSYLDDKGQLKNPSLQPCQKAISAVKAIAIDQSQGQKIYTINKDNVTTALAKLPGVNAEIRNAIEAGKEVTFHEKAISAHGWSGQGYIIVDPETGAGAYLIEGKGNEGYLETLGEFIAVLFMALLAALTIIEMIALSTLSLGALVTVYGLLSLWEIYNFSKWYNAMSTVNSAEEFKMICASYAFGAAIGIVPAVTVGATAFQWFAIFIVFILTIRVINFSGSTSRHSKGSAKVFDALQQAVTHTEGAALKFYRWRNLPAMKYEVQEYAKKQAKKTGRAARFLVMDEGVQIQRRVSPAPKRLSAQRRQSCGCSALWPTLST